MSPGSPRAQPVTVARRHVPELIILSRTGPAPAHPRDHFAEHLVVAADLMRAGMPPRPGGAR